MFPIIIQNRGTIAAYLVLYLDHEQWALQTVPCATQPGPFHLLSHKHSQLCYEININLTYKQHPDGMREIPTHVWTVMCSKSSNSTKPGFDKEKLGNTKSYFLKS